MMPAMGFGMPDAFQWGTPSPQEPETIKRAELRVGVRCRLGLPPRRFLRNDRLLCVLETPQGLAAPQHNPFCTSWPVEQDSGWHRMQRYGGVACGRCSRQTRRLHEASNCRRIDHHGCSASLGLRDLTYLIAPALSLPHEDAPIPCARHCEARNHGM